MKQTDAKNRGRRNAGFTLIELLVVIAIIALLAAILFPVFARAREKGRQAACSSNMRQIGIALRMYVDDYDGEMPRTSHDHSNSPVVWVQSLKPYVASVDEIRLCPSDLHNMDKTSTRFQVGTSYVLNEYISVPQRDELTGQIKEDPDVYTALDMVPRPSETFLMFELSDAKEREAYWDHTHSFTWFNSPNPAQRWNSITGEIEVDRHGQGTRPEDGGVSNYLYCDAHVKALPARKIKGWVDQNFNFAKPPK